MDEQRNRATPLGCSDAALDDLHRAEALLYELAIVLRRVPIDDHTRDLHVRALGLKRDVERWHAQLPDDSQRQAMLDELVRLQRDAATLDALPFGPPRSFEYAARTGLLPDTMEAQSRRAARSK